MNKSSLTERTGLSSEELYLKIWEREQEHTKTRWNVTTFFVSISFAIFGFSLRWCSRFVAMSLKGLHVERFRSLNH